MFETNISSVTFIPTLRFEHRYGYLVSAFTIDLASPPDRENLVAEIFFGTTQVAELNREGDYLAIEIYPRPDGHPWAFRADEFLATVAKARSSLLER